jgi:hypothetical protein
MARIDAKENISIALPHRYPVLASQTLYGGNFACGITTDGYIRPGADTANFLVKGIVPSSVGSVVDTSGVSGTEECPVVSGVTCWMGNDGTNPVTAADRGKICYLKTATTVCVVGGSSNSVVAGIVLDVDATRGVKLYIPHGGMLP